MSSFEAEDCAAVFCPACCDGDEDSSDEDAGAGSADRDGPLDLDGAELVLPATALLAVELLSLAAFTALGSVPAESKVASSEGVSLLRTGSEEGPGVRETEDVGAMRREVAIVLLRADAVATVRVRAADDVVVSARAMGMLAER